MQIKHMREMGYGMGTPYQKGRIDAESFVRCLDGNGAPGSPRMGSVYLVRDVTEVVDQDRGRTAYLYKLDGFEGGVKSEKCFRANQFQRWVPAVGDLVTRGTNPTPLLVSKVDTGFEPAADRIQLHHYSNDRKVWAYMDSDRGQEIRPALGLQVSADTIDAVHNAANVLNAVIQDETFIAPVNREIPAEENLDFATKGDRAREVRIQQLKKNYLAALETVIYSNDQYVMLMGEPLKGGKEIRNVGEQLGIVKPVIRR